MPPLMGARPPTGNPGSAAALYQSRSDIEPKRILILSHVQR